MRSNYPIFKDVKIHNSSLVLTSPFQDHSEYLSYHQYYEMEFLGVKA